MFKIPRAGAVAIAASPAQHGLEVIAGAAETPGQCAERAEDAHQAATATATR
jgi:hypothetical protein